MKAFRLVSAVLAAVIIMVALPVGPGARAETVSSETEITENESLRLSVFGNGELTLSSKQSGETVKSRLDYAKNDSHSSGLVKKMMSSELVIDYYSEKDILTSSVSTKGYSDEAEVTVKKENDAIRASYNFAELSISFDVVYTLGKDYLSASIDFKSIKETADLKLLQITLLPALFAGTGDDNGYIFVPDGSGALINFNNNSIKDYNADVYGTEASKDNNMKTSYDRSIRMPVYGMVKNGSGMFAIIESGDAVASISAASANTESYYNYVNATANIRSTCEKAMFTANDKTNQTVFAAVKQTDGAEAFTVRFYLLGKGADYVEMAKVYRNYLTNEEGLEKQKTSAELNVELIGAIDVKANFLGFSYYKSKALTEYSEALDIVKELKKDGIENIAVRYLGWSNNGMTNASVMKKVKASGVLGGKKDLRLLNEYLNGEGISAYYDIDMLKFYKGAKKYKVSSPFNDRISFSRYLRSVYAKDISKRSWYLLSAKYLESNYSSLEKNLKRFDMESYSLASVTSSIYSDFNSKDTVTRSEMLNSAAAVLKAAGKTAGETANSYALPYLNKIFSVPMYSSGYLILDKEIPFYEITLHGMIDLTGESQFVSNDRSVNYLKTVETGLQLMYTGMAADSSEIVDTDYDYLYGTSFSLWKDDAVSKYKEYYPLLKEISDSLIVSHRELQDNVFETGYENGIRVIVNYNSQDVQADGIKIPAYGFARG